MKQIYRHFILTRLAKRLLRAQENAAYWRGVFDAYTATCQGKFPSDQADSRARACGNWKKYEARATTLLDSIRDWQSR